MGLFLLIMNNGTIKDREADGIIDRGGGELVVELFASDSSDRIDDSAQVMARCGTV